MKMISSAKMHKAEQSLRKLGPFRQQIESIIGNLLSADAEFSSPLTESRDIHRLGIVIFGSDDGLCGAYNVNIFKELLKLITTYRGQFGDNVDIVLYPVGAKIAKAVAKIAGLHISIVETPDVDSKTTGDGVKIFMEYLRDSFIKCDIDRVDMLYTSFHSAGRQAIKSEQFLPVVAETFATQENAETNRPYLFEPDAPTIFQSVLPMYLLAVAQDIFTENRASEQAARVMAMQSANDNAKKLLEELQLEYNKLRQQGITTELLDILGGQVRD